MNSQTETNPTSVGQLLRRRRAEMGADAASVARELRIRRCFVDAIENGRTSELPGPAYAVGFVRAYAECLGLDGDEIVRRFKSEHDVLQHGRDLHFPAPVSEGGTPKGGVFLIAALIGLVTYGAWYLGPLQTGSVSDGVLPVPDRLRHLLSDSSSPGMRTTAAIETAMPPAPATAHPGTVQQQALPLAATTTPPASPVQQGAAEQTPAALPLAPPTNAPMTLATLAPTGTTSRPPTTPVVTAGPIEAAGGGSSISARASTFEDHLPASIDPVGLMPRILLHARAESWVEVRDDRSRSVVVARLLRPGETYSVPNRAGLTLLTGNAGGLDIVVDGQVLPPLGPNGAVRRGIALEADQLRGG
jgi:cytoskeleton protein RodZ